MMRIRSLTKLLTDVREKIPIYFKNWWTELQALLENKAGTLRTCTSIIFLINFRIKGDQRFANDFSGKKHDVSFSLIKNSLLCC